MMQHFSMTMTVADAREKLYGLAKAEGTTCPVCEQTAKVYPYSLASSWAQALIAMYCKGGTGWVHVPDLNLPGGHFAKLRFWGLIERKDDERGDEGNPRVGWWRVTVRGEMFVKGRTTVPKKIHVYNNKCVGMTGDPIDIRAALGRRFSYEELMGPSGVGPVDHYSTEVYA